MQAKTELLLPSSKINMKMKIFMGFLRKACIFQGRNLSGKIFDQSIADMFIVSLIKYTRNFGASPLLPFLLNEPSRRGEPAFWILIQRLLPEPGEPWTQNNSPDSPVSGLWSGLLGNFTFFPTLLGNNGKAEEEHTQPGRSLILSLFLSCDIA